MNSHPSFVRIATDLTTRKRYIVLAVRNGLVHVYGDVYHAKGLRSRHKPGIQYQRELVEIEEVRFSKELLRTLLRQHLRSLREEGYEVTMSFTSKGEISYEAVNGVRRISIS
jgi:alkylated DNA nucleotide flippase Atl1